MWLGFVKGEEILHMILPKGAHMQPYYLHTCIQFIQTIDWLICLTLLCQRLSFVF